MAHKAEHDRILEAAAVIYATVQTLDLGVAVRRAIALDEEVRDQLKAKHRAEAAREK